MPNQEDTVARLIHRFSENSKSPSMVRCTERVLTRAEAVARQACRAEARDLPPMRIEELVQDVLEIVWTKVRQFDPALASFEGWVRGIAVNICRNARRKRRDLLSDDGVFEATDPTSSVLARMEREERNAVIVCAIEQGLDQQDKDVLFHRYVHEMGRTEIAEILDMRDADEVRVHLIRARRHLRNAIMARLSELGHSVSLLRSEAE